MKATKTMRYQDLNVSVCPRFHLDSAGKGDYELNRKQEFGHFCELRLFLYSFWLQTP